MLARNCFLLVALTFWMGNAAAVYDPQHPQRLPADYAAGLIVKTENKQALKRLLTSIQTLADGQGIRLRPARVMSDGAHVIDADRYLPLTQATHLAADVAALPDVEYAEPNVIMQPALIPDDPSYPQQWHYFDAIGGIRLPNAWDITTGANVVVAVLDTGYRPHVDLAANLLPGYDMISNIFIGNDGDGRDDDASDPGDWVGPAICGGAHDGEISSWHGTHVAGTIAAVSNNAQGVAGIAFDARILPVRVLGRCGGPVADIADGIRWAAGLDVPDVPHNPTPAQVVNMSLGGIGVCLQTYANAIAAARAANVTIIVAAGNDDQNASNSQPANCNGVITVAATTQAGGKSSYSNFGDLVDLAAPGDAVLSTLNSGTTHPDQDTYALYWGTSMAAPHVAGVAALMHALAPGITPDEVEQILKNTARDFPQTCAACGSGILDATAAIEAVVSNPIPLRAWMIPVLDLITASPDFEAWMIPLHELIY